MKATALLVIISLTFPAAVSGQSDPKSRSSGGSGRTGTPSNAPVSQLRISGRVYVGERAPDFSLWSSRNRELKLSRTRGDWVVLCFGNTRENLGELRPVHTSLAPLGVTVLGVCREKPQTLRTYAERDSIPFEMLADITGEISAMYGLYDFEHRATLPGFLVLDREGVVRLALLGQALPPGDIAELARFTMTGLQ